MHVRPARTTALIPTPPITTDAIWEARGRASRDDVVQRVGIRCWATFAALRMQGSVSISQPQTDCWWNSCLLSRAECRVEEGETNGYKAPLHTQLPPPPPPPLISSPPPPPQASSTSQIAHTERELPEICLHILLLSASPLSPALRWIHHQVS